MEHRLRNAKRTNARSKAVLVLDAEVEVSYCANGGAVKKWN